MKRTHALWLAIVSVGATGCFEPAPTIADTDASSETGIGTTGDVGDSASPGASADSTTGGVVADDTTAGATNATGMTDDTSGSMPATTGGATGGCMPGVFGSSVFGDACFQ